MESFDDLMPKQIKSSLLRVSGTLRIMTDENSRFYAKEDPNPRDISEVITDLLQIKQDWEGMRNKKPLAL